MQKCHLDRGVDNLPAKLLVVKIRNIAVFVEYQLVAVIFKRVVSGGNSGAYFAGFLCFLNFICSKAKWVNICKKCNSKLFAELTAKLAGNLVSVCVIYRNTAAVYSASYCNLNNLASLKLCSVVDYNNAAVVINPRGVKLVKYSLNGAYVLVLKLRKRKVIVAPAFVVNLHG